MLKNLKDLFIIIAVEKENKWESWETILSNEDIDTPADILSLSEEVLNSIKIPALLKSLLLKWRNDQKVDIISNNIVATPILNDLPIVPFGKYKGKSVLDLMVDTGYVEWCKEAQVFRKYPKINIILNNSYKSSEFSETPEHNKLQNKFMETDFVKRYIEYILPEYDFTQQSGMHDIFNIGENLLLDVTPEGIFSWDIILKVGWRKYMIYLPIPIVEASALNVFIEKNGEEYKIEKNKLDKKKAKYSCCLNELNKKMGEIEIEKNNIKKEMGKYSEESFFLQHELKKKRLKLK